MTTTSKYSTLVQEIRQVCHDYGISVGRNRLAELEQEKQWYKRYNLLRETAIRLAKKTRLPINLRHLPEVLPPESDEVARRAVNQQLCSLIGEMIEKFRARKMPTRRKPLKDLRPLFLLVCTNSPRDIKLAIGVVSAKNAKAAAKKAGLQVVEDLEVTEGEMGTLICTLPFPQHGLFRMQKIPRIRNKEDLQARLKNIL